LSGKSHLSTYETALSTLDLGTIEFMKWLVSKDTNSGESLIDVKDFLENKYVILFDKSLSNNIIVDYRSSMPWCIPCDVDDCGHVGFAICLKQYYDRNDNVIF
jgi:hypothetical protein